MSDRQNMPIPSESGAYVTQAWARATLARMVAELFAEPDATWSDRFTDFQVMSECRRALFELGLSTECIPPVPTREDALIQRDCLFGHTVRSACPPYELEYGQREVFQQSQMLADVAGFYSAFGLQTAGPLAERPDHVVAEWEFLALLAMKEAAAEKGGDRAGIDCCRNAQRDFLRDHAASWMPAFGARIRKTEPNGFFAQVSTFAGMVLKHLCSEFDVRSGPSWLELRSIEDDDTTISCGAGGAAPIVELGPTLAAAINGN